MTRFVIAPDAALHLARTQAVVSPQPQIPTLQSEPIHRDYPSVIRQASTKQPLAIVWNWPTA